MPHSHDPTDPDPVRPATGLAAVMAGLSCGYPVAGVTLIVTGSTTLSLAALSGTGVVGMLAVLAASTWPNGRQTIPERPGVPIRTIAPVCGRLWQGPAWRKCGRHRAPLTFKLTNADNVRLESTATILP